MNSSCKACGLYKKCNSYKMEAKEDTRPLEDSGLKGGTQRPILIIHGNPTPSEDGTNTLTWGNESFLSMFLEQLEVPYVLTYAVKCSPGVGEDGKYIQPQDEQVSACRPFLVEDVEKYNPSCIVWLGGTAMRAVYGDQAPSSIKKAIDMGEVTLGGIPVLGHYSPRMHGRSRNLLEDYISLFTKAERIAQGKLQKVPFNFEVIRSEADAMKLDTPKDTPLFLDVEVKQSKDHPDMATMHHPKAELLCLGFSYRLPEGGYMNYVLTPEACSERVLGKLFAFKYVYAHNTKYDFSAVKRFTGVDLYDIISDSGDTMHDMYGFDVGARGLSLKKLASNHLNADDWSSNVWPYIDNAYDVRNRTLKQARKEKKHWSIYNLDAPFPYASFADVPEGVLFEYNARDVYWTARLWHEVITQHPLWEEYKNSHAYRLMKDATRFLMDMEFEGLHVNEDLLREYTQDALKEIDRLQEMLEGHPTARRARDGFIIDPETAPFKLNKFYCPEVEAYDMKPVPSVNVKSVKFLNNLAMLTGHHTGKTTSGGMLAFDKDTLKALAGVYPPVAPEDRTNEQKLYKLIYDIRQLRDLNSKYLTNLPKYIVDGRIHTNYKMTSTVTTRLSSADPNLQNIKRDSDIRRIFYAPKGWMFLSCDYDRIELVMLAWLAQEPTMLKAIREGQDLHQVTADLLGVSRDMAKTANFGIVYGQSVKAFAATAKISLEEAASFFEKFYQTYSAITTYFESLDAIVYAGDPIKTPDGRMRTFTLTGEYFKDEELKRQWRNFPLQAIASNLTLSAGCRFHQRLRNTSWGPWGHEVAKPGNIIHDDLLTCVRTNFLYEVAKLKVDTMKDTSSLPFNLDGLLGVGCKVGTNWKDMREVTLDEIKQLADGQAPYIHN